MGALAFFLPPDFMSTRVKLWCRHPEEGLEPDCGLQILALSRV